MRTLIITDTYDATTDLLIKYTGSENIYRLNYDDIAHTRIRISSNELLLFNGCTEIYSHEIKKVLWRKPFNSQPSYEEYLESELKYVFREIFNLFLHEGKAILVRPRFEATNGKLLSLRIAKRYFDVPEWYTSLNYKLSYESKVVKSLTSELVKPKQVLYTTSVSTESLDASYPWFIQSKVGADFDVTSVYIDGNIFSYQLKRNQYLDWRSEINKSNQNWEIHDLPQMLEESLRSFMNCIGLKFGRIDWLKTGDKYTFLEVNPNGQWAWLDLENTNGLMSKMVEYVLPSTELKGCLTNKFLDY